jgi:uncharacterized metal-binding protein
MKCDHCDNLECYNGKDCFGTGGGLDLYGEDDFLMLKTAAAVEADGYLKLTRLEEIILFAEKMGYRKLGLAYCVGLREEAYNIAEILRRHFEISSVMCKVGGVSKAENDIERIQDDRYEAVCNPALQSKLLDEDGVDLNVVIGLCVGHDALFYKYSRAPVTTLAVKDRVLAHNPLAAVYCQYLKRRFD